MSRIGASEFLQVIRPALAARDAVALAEAVHAHWTLADLVDLLDHESSDVRSAAAITLGVAGDMSCSAALTKALRDEASQVNEMAEHGLWMIWFRNCCTEAAAPFQSGVALLALERYRQAIDRFESAARLDRQFAEAHNQRAIALHLLGQWSESIDACRDTIRLVPTHFGAIAGMGHGYVRLGSLQDALRCYRTALKINPHLQCIRTAAGTIESGHHDPEAGGFAEATRWQA
ncbi:MAG: hypothetical protein CMJ18_28060 [Phycisphaeraceae bacterium]|nr:hypothetical protein [Phycisphaeraceae bacterium]